MDALIRGCGSADLPLVVHKVSGSLSDLLISFALGDGEVTSAKKASQNLGVLMETLKLGTLFNV